MEDVKIKLSALWVAGMLNGLMMGMLELFEPGHIQQILTGEVGGMKITQELLFGMAVLMVFAPLMVFLSVTLNYKANRWANIIFGIVFAGFGLLELLETKSAYVIFGVSVGIAFSVLIVWYAWKWPKPEA